MICLHRAWRRIGRLAAAGESGRPHVVPTGYVFTSLGVRVIKTGS